MPSSRRLPQFSDGWQAPDPRASVLFAKPGLAHFRSVQSSPDSDTATAQTIEIMCRHIKEAAGDADIRAVAVDAVRRFRGGPLPPVDPRAVAAFSDWWWCRHYLTFRHHEFQILAILGETQQLQLLIPPAVLLKLKAWEGDCAIYTMLICAMLHEQGIPYEIVTVATNPDEPAVFSHVYPRAIVGELRISLDAIPSAGEYPGWQVPSSRVFKLQVWDENGKPVADCDARYRGLGQYRVSRRGMGRLRGLGCGCSEMDDSGNCLDPDPCLTGSTTYGPTLQQLGITTPEQAANVFSTGGTTAGGGANPWTGFVQNLASAWTNIAGKVIAPTVTVTRGPNGQLIYSAPAGSNTGALSIPGITSVGSLSSWLPLLGIGVAALIAIKAVGK